MNILKLKPLLKNFTAIGLIILLLTSCEKESIITQQREVENDERLIGEEITARYDCNKWVGDDKAQPLSGNDPKELKLTTKTKTHRAPTSCAYRGFQYEAGITVKIDGKLNDYYWVGAPFQGKTDYGWIVIQDTYTTNNHDNCNKWVGPESIEQLSAKDPKQLTFSTKTQAYRAPNACATRDFKYISGTIVEVIGKLDGFYWVRVPGYFDGATDYGWIQIPSNNDLHSSGEPKSIHTWLDSDKSGIYNYDIDIRVNEFPSNAEPDWLYYFSLQVNFTDHDEWSHGGFQWANVVDFRQNNYKGVNWGGGSEWAGYGGIGSTNTPYTWKKDKWYRYRVWRLSKDDEGFWHWGFWVLDYETGEDNFYGTVKTKSEFIKNAVVWIETGYGVECNTEKAHIEWRKPTFRCLEPGLFSPNKGTATYNGTCEGVYSTNQALVSNSPLQWFQATKSNRRTDDFERLW